MRISDWSSDVCSSDLFEQAVRRCPEIKECFLVAGAFDYWLQVEAESAAQYEAIHSGILSRLPGVTRISSNLALRDARPEERRGGKRVSVRLVPGGRRILKKTKNIRNIYKKFIK